MGMVEYKKILSQYMKNRSIRYGLPFLLFCVGSSFVFKEVADVRYKYRNVESFREKAMGEKLPLKKLDEITLEAEYEKLKEVDLEDWENIRIDRPWEETNGK